MGKEKNCQHENSIVPQPAHTTYCTASSHFPVTVPPYLCLCSLHHYLILYLDGEVAYLSVAAPNTSPRVSVGTWKAVWRASAKPPNLSHFILSWGNLPGSEKASLSVYEMLMWIASAPLCGWEHRGPLLVVKPTCSVCFSMCETVKPAKLQ